MKNPFFFSLFCFSEPDLPDCLPVLHHVVVAGSTAPEVLARPTKLPVVLINVNESRLLS